MTKSLFNGFDVVSAKEWKQKIQFDLKGADYNEALIHKSYEGIDIKPFYNHEDIPTPQYKVEHPPSWLNSIKISINTATEGKIAVVDAIDKGAESIYLIITNKEIDPKELLNIPLQLPIYIETLFLSIDYNQKLNEVASKYKGDIFLLTDIIGNLSKTGNWFKNLNEDHNLLSKTLKESTHLKNYISVDISLLQNAGATMIQQLAYGLAHANEYLNYLENYNMISFDKTSIVFKVAVGGNYFFEIAKLRALRILWSTLSSEYNTIKKCIIIAHPSERNKTFLDYNVNMLRTTTECMSSILGGADIIYNLPYDNTYNSENEFGTRTAINQLLILKNESYFGLVNNPASGSYYIESLTRQLSEKALLLFKNIEKAGGYLKHIKEGIIQKKIKESAEKEQELFDNENIILTGANKYKNREEIPLSFRKTIFFNKKSTKTLTNPIIKRRLCEKIEKISL